MTCANTGHNEGMCVQQLFARSAVKRQYIPFQELTQAELAPIAHKLLGVSYGPCFIPPILATLFGIFCSAASGIFVLAVR